MFVVFDLDGTLALTEHRAHFLKRPSKEKDWRGFYAACDKDQPCHPIIWTPLARRCQPMDLPVMKRFLAPLFALLALAAPALAQTSDLPPGEIRPNGDITFGNALKLGKREGNLTVITPDTLQILGSGSTGDASGLSATLPGGTAGTLKDLLTGSVSAAPYLLNRSGAAQVTEGLQAAVAAVVNQGGALLIPPGDYTVDGLTVDATKGGTLFALPGTVKLRASKANVTLITVINSQAGFNPVNIDGVGFYGNNFANATGIRCDNPLFLNIRNIHTHFIDYAARITSNRPAGSYKVTVANVTQWGQGSWIFEGAEAHKFLFDVNISNVNHFSGGGTVWRAAWFTFRNVISLNLSNVLSNSLDGAANGFDLLEHIEGVFASNVIVGFPKTGVRIARLPGQATPPAYIYLSNFAIDQPTETGFDVDAYVLKVTNGNVTGSRYRNGTGPAFLVRAKAEDVAITNFLISDNNRDGLKVEQGARHVSVAQANIRGNAVASGFDVNVAANSPLDPVFGDGNWLGTVNITGQILSNGKTSRYWAVDRTQTGTPASTVSTPLKVYWTPAGRIPVGKEAVEQILPLGATLRVRSTGRFGSNGNAKSLSMNFAGTDIVVTSGRYNNLPWSVEMDIEPAGVGGQNWVTAKLYVGTTLVAQTNRSVVADLKASQVINIYAANAVAAANDVTAATLTVEAVL
jgi:hypothetical protein